MQVDLYCDLEKNHRVMKDLFDRCYDINFRIFRIGKQIEAEIIFVDSMAHFDEINTHILAPLMRKACSRPEEVEEFLREELPAVYVKPIGTFDECARQVSSGEPVLFIDGWNRALNLGLSQLEKRAVNDPGGRAGHSRPQGGIHRIGPDEYGPVAPQDPEPPIEDGRDAVGALHPNPGHHRLYGGNCQRRACWMR